MSGVPVGSTCKVTEAPPGTDWSVSLPADITVTAAGPNTATVTNTYVAVPTVVLGKTRGFWGNRVGNSILSAAAPSPFPLSLGGALEKVDVLNLGASNTYLRGNGCTIDTTACKNTRVQRGTVETLLAQTLALTYNARYVSGYNGQTVAGLGCTVDPVLTSLGLSASSTVDQVRIASNALINGLHLPATTQAQGGAMNALLGCLNREA